MAAARVGDAHRSRFVQKSCARRFDTPPPARRLNPRRGPLNKLEGTDLPSTAAARIAPVFHVENGSHRPVADHAAHGVRRGIGTTPAPRAIARALSGAGLAAAYWRCRRTQRHTECAGYIDGRPGVELRYTDRRLLAVGSAALETHGGRLGARHVHTRRPPGQLLDRQIVRRIRIERAAVLRVNVAPRWPMENQVHRRLHEVENQQADEKRWPVAARA